MSMRVLILLVALVATTRAEELSPAERDTRAHAWFERGRASFKLGHYPVEDRAIAALQVAHARAAGVDGDLAVEARHRRIYVTASEFHATVEVALLVSGASRARSGG